MFMIIVSIPVLEMYLINFYEINLNITMVPIELFSNVYEN